MIIICAYAPTLVTNENDKDQFYCSLTRILQGVNREDKLRFKGDFNARVGADVSVWPGVLGWHSAGSMNDNGLRPLTL